MCWGGWGGVFRLAQTPPLELVQHCGGVGKVFNENNIAEIRTIVDFANLGGIAAL